MQNPSSNKTYVKFNISKFIEKNALPIAALYLFHAAARVAFIYYGILYARSKGVTDAWLMLTIYAVANVICRPLAGCINDKTDNKTAILIGTYILIAMGFFILTQNIYTGSLMIGMGFSMEVVFINSNALKKSPPKNFGRTVSTLEVVNSFGVIICSTAYAAYNGPLEYLFLMMVAVYLIAIGLVIVYWRKALI